MIKDLITVIISTKNANSDHLLLAVNSMLEQSYKKIELIVIIDGGEYDGVLSRIKDNRLRVIRHNKSLGLATRLNEGLRLANGEYIARMDSDDYSLPDRLRFQWSFMKKNPGVDICSMFAKEFGDGKKMRVNANTQNSCIKSELFINNIIIHPTVMFRRSSIEKYDIKYNEDFDCSQDYELWTRISKSCVFKVIPKIGLFYRIHSDQTTTKKRTRQLNFCDKVSSRELDELGLDEKDIEFVKMLNGRVPITDIEKERIFINKCLKMNNKNQIYEKKSLKDVLYRHLFMYCLKKRTILKGIKFLRWYTCAYVIKKNFLLWRCKVQMRKYSSLYNKLNMDHGE